MIDIVASALAIALSADAQGIAAEHVEVVGPTLDVRRHLAPKQREIFDAIHVDGAPAIDVLGGRQGGKTFVDVAIAIEGGRQKHGTINPYFGLTGESVSDIWWPEVVQWWTLLGWPPTSLSAATHTAAIPDTGSVLRGFGTTSMGHVETRRGPKYNVVVIDEMGAQPDDRVRYLLEVVRPTLVRHRGQMVRSGNPGRVLAGYWYTQTGPARTATTPLFGLTAWDNPALGTAEEIDAFVSAQLVDACGLTLDEVRQRIADGDRSGPIVTYEREWLARWGTDDSALVYPFDLARNGVDGLPMHNTHGVLLAPDLWRYVAVCDPAGKGYTGFAVVAGHPQLIRRFVVESEKCRGMLIGQAAAKLREYKRRYPNVRLMLDAGGLGSVHSQQFSREFALYVEDAAKSDKPSVISSFHDNLLAGTIAVVNGPRNDAWRSEAAACGWDKARLMHDPNAEDHCLDAACYGDRRLRTWPQAEERMQSQDPVAVAQREAARMRERTIAKLQPTVRERWDR